MTLKLFSVLPMMRALTLVDQKMGNLDCSIRQKVKYRGVRDIYEMKMKRHKLLGLHLVLSWEMSNHQVDRWR